MLTDEGADVIEVEAMEEVLVWPCCSLELREAVLVELEVLEGGGGYSDRAEVRSRAETLLVTRSRVVFGSCGTLIPKLRAVRKNCRSTSSSVVSWLNRRTIIL